jgi:hypothetical protein
MVKSTCSPICTVSLEKYALGLISWATISWTENNANKPSSSSLGTFNSGFISQLKQPDKHWNVIFPGVNTEIVYLVFLAECLQFRLIAAKGIDQFLAKGPGGGIDPVGLSGFFIVQRNNAQTG